MRILIQVIVIVVAVPLMLLYFGKSHIFMQLHSPNTPFCQNKPKGLMGVLCILSVYLLAIYIHILPYKAKRVYLHKKFKIINFLFFT